MFLSRKEACYLFRFPALSRFPALAHAILSRDGNGSRPPFDGMNMSLGVGDATDAVIANRRRLRRIIGGRMHVYARQDHGTVIHVVNREALRSGEGIHIVPGRADALVTDVPGVQLVIQTADCQAVMLFDSRKGVVANIHNGWRGSAADIIGRTVARMVADFDCDPACMTAAIGPSLGPCCAEFVNYEAEIPSALWPFRVGVHHFDFWRISRHQLAKAGLKPDQVHSADVCTRCNPHLFYSYRAAQRTGRFAALIGLRDGMASRT